LLLAIALSLAAVNAACSKESDCWYNGVCKSGACVCDVGWMGESCTVLNLKPAPMEGAYGYSPNVSSWGGVPILIDGTYHLYVAEMVNHCGLCEWQYNSRVVHATSSSLLGPYKFKDQSLGVWAHNPQITVDKTGSEPVYLLFHLGNGNMRTPKVCNNSATSSHLVMNHKSTMKETIKQRDGIKAPLAGGMTLHTATNPAGPWTAQDTPECNNPAPYVHKNGSILLVCSCWQCAWHAYTAPSWKGPWKDSPFTLVGDGGKGIWEDPFIWLDTRGVYKMLSHAFLGGGTEYAIRVGGFAYSFDGKTWTRSPNPPFDNKITQVNGVVKTEFTRERPKIFFDKDGTTPLALFNGVCDAGHNKELCGNDWTYNWGQPIGA